MSTRVQTYDPQSWNTVGLAIVRTYTDASLLAVTDNIIYVDTNGDPVDFAGTPADAGARAALLFVDTSFIGTASPSRRTVIHNRGR